MRPLVRAPPPGGTEIKQLKPDLTCWHPMNHMCVAQPHHGEVTNGSAGWPVGTGKVTLSPDGTAAAPRTRGRCQQENKKNADRLSNAALAATLGAPRHGCRSMLDQLGG
jgi:hypothetical protein